MTGEIKTMGELAERARDANGHCARLHDDLEDMIHAEGPELAANMGETRAWSLGAQKMLKALEHSPWEIVWMAGHAQRENRLSEWAAAVNPDDPGKFSDETGAMDEAGLKRLTEEVARRDPISLG